MYWYLHATSMEDKAEGNIEWMRYLTRLHKQLERTNSFRTEKIYSQNHREHYYYNFSSIQIIYDEIISFTPNSVIMHVLL